MSVNFCANPKVPEAIKAISSNADIIPGRLKAVKSREVFKGSVILIAQDKAIESVLSEFKTQRLNRIAWAVDESNRVIRLASKGRSLIGRVLRDFIVRKQGPANVAGLLGFGIVFITGCQSIIAPYVAYEPLTLDLKLEQVTTEKLLLVAKLTNISNNDL
jgi:hypothetical protein